MIDDCLLFMTEAARTSLVSSLDMEETAGSALSNISTGVSVAVVV